MIQLLPTRGDAMQLKKLLEKWDLTDLEAV